MTFSVNRRKHIFVKTLVKLKLSCIVDKSHSFHKFPGMVWIKKIKKAITR
jgi:hypothetical protein